MMNNRKKTFRNFIYLILIHLRQLEKKINLLKFKGSEKHILEF